MPVARRGDDAHRHLADIGVGPAVDIVVQIVEFADGGEARLEHLHIGEGGDRLDVVRREPRRKRYITSRQVQKLSACGPRRSASAAIARWKAWQCRFGRPGMAMPDTCSAPALGAPSSTEAITPSATAMRTALAQPFGSSA